jgi:hypothetical protein
MKFTTSLFIAISALCFSTTLAAPIGLGVQAQANSQHDTQGLMKRSPMEEEKLTWFQKKAMKIKNAAAAATKIALTQAKKTASNVANNKHVKNAATKIKDKAEKVGKNLAESNIGKKASKAVDNIKANKHVIKAGHMANTAVSAIKANTHVINAGNMLNDQKKAWNALDISEKKEGLESALPAQ